MRAARTQGFRERLVQLFFRQVPGGLVNFGNGFIQAVADLLSQTPCMRSASPVERRNSPGETKNSDSLVGNPSDEHPLLQSDRYGYLPVAGAADSSFFICSIPALAASAGGMPASFWWQASLQQANSCPW